MSVTIRNAQADDAPFLARVMLMASRSHRPYGLWDQFVKGDENNCLSFLRKIAVTKTPHLFHHDVFIIAEKDGKAVAGLSGYNPESHGMKFFSRIVPEVCEEIGWTKTDLKEAFKRLMPFVNCMSAEVSGVWIVESVAALPDERRQGMMNLLLQEILAKGKTQGFKAAQISVLINNTPARTAYEKAGFRYVDEKRDHEFEATYGDHGIARLMMDLR
jgi:GNAT superfamily N-acetyltransferase